MIYLSLFTALSMMKHAFRYKMEAYLGSRKNGIGGEGGGWLDTASVSWVHNKCDHHQTRLTRWATFAINIRHELFCCDNILNKHSDIREMISLKWWRWVGWWLTQTVWLPLVGYQNGTKMRKDNTDGWLVYCVVIAIIVIVSPSLLLSET